MLPEHISKVLNAVQKPVISSKGLIVDLQSLLSLNYTCSSELMLLLNFFLMKHWIS